MTEADTWNAFRQGDRSAFAKIYFDHYEGLLNYGRRFGLPPELVEDTIQDLFVELWQYRATTSPTTSIRFYLLRALRNQLSRHRREPLFTDIEHDTLSFTAEFSFEQQWIDSLDEQQQTQALQRALNALTPRQREILYLRFFNNLDYPQIAAVMNLSYQAARNQVYLALKAIREQFPANWRLLLALMQVAWTSQ
ncbi:RNA polymerase sigma factor [Spirosoma montaniterrae]|uniref:RNA polymerase subunit sigma-24 n=1 Tax=Spirosoma montaniterrae TaxID=1178516 RepID=A0A1P9WXJ7_9BACT|nr:sigma-70 family RNA polymerase sigma factor [Spirosoma montaniterrae]AQG80126.1 hypothetical protein AWR27_12800 [Spirosoma montaniterrae]